MSGITLTEVDDATIATPATGKATIFLDDTLGPAYKDDTGTVTSFEGDAAPALSYQNHGNTGATETIDASAADVHRLVLNAATVTITLSGAPAAGTVKVIQAYLEQDGTGGRDLSWPGSVVWPADSGEPDWTTRTGGQIDLVSLETVDGGTTWAASVAGAPGAAGTDGPVGGAVAIPYVFSTTTTDADPGAGNLRLDNATQNSATKIRADLAGSDGATYTTIIDSMDDSTNTVKGHIRLVKTDDPTKFLLFTVSAVDSSSGYRNITVANVGSSAASPFSASDAITLSFTRAGDQGGAGGAPADGQYLVGALNGSLSAEKVKAALYKNYDPDEYPTSGTTLTDEFDDSSLDAAWTWDTAPGGTVSETTYPGFLYLTGGTDSSGTVRLLRRAFTPGAAAFSVAAKMNLAVENGNYNTAFGIGLVDSSDVNIWNVALAGDGTVTASDGYRVTSTASTWITAATVPLVTAPMYLLITRSAANVYKGYISANGIVWQYIGTSTVATTVAKVVIRYGIDTDALDDDASIDFIRVFTTETKKIGA